MWSDGSHTDFGSRGSTDYTLGASEATRKGYRARHIAQNRARIMGDPKSAAALSYWILWGGSRSVKANERAFRKRFSV